MSTSVHAHTCLLQNNELSLDTQTHANNTQTTHSNSPPPLHPHTNLPPQTSPLHKLHHLPCALTATEMSLKLINRSTSTIHANIQFIHTYTNSPYTYTCINVIIISFDVLILPCGNERLKSVLDFAIMDKSMFTFRMSPSTHRLQFSFGLSTCLL